MRRRHHAFAHRSPTVDVLQHHDRIVNNHAHRERQPSKRNDIERSPQSQQHEKRADHRDWDRQHDDTRRDKRSQEQQQHERSNRAADPQVLRDQSNRGMNVDRFVIDLPQEQAVANFGVETGKHVALQFGELFSYIIHERDDVGVILADDVHRERGAVDRTDETSLPRVAQLHIGHIRDIHRLAAAIDNDHVEHIFRGFELPCHADAKVAFALGCGACCDIAVFTSQCGDKPIVGDPSLRHGHRIDHDAHLAFSPAEDVHLRHTFDALDVRLDLPVHRVLKRGDVEIGMRCLRVQRQFDHDPRDGVFAGAFARFDDRFGDVFGIVRHAPKRVGHILPSPVDIGSDVKLQRDRGAALVGDRAHRLEILDVLENLLLLLGDLVNDLLRASAGPARGDRDDRLIDVGRQLHRNRAEPDQSEHDEKDHADRHADRFLDRQANNVHAFSPRAVRAFAPTMIQRYSMAAPDTVVRCPRRPRSQQGQEPTRE